MVLISTIVVKTGYSMVIYDAVSDRSSDFNLHIEPGDKLSNFRGSSSDAIVENVEPGRVQH